MGWLSACMKAGGWKVMEPIEAYRDGKYDPSQDVLIPEVSAGIIESLMALWCYCHFGTPCSSFSRLRAAFCGTSRTVDNPWGDESDPAEALGNKLLRWTFHVIASMHKKGLWWSFEHPTSSMAWHTDVVKSMCLQRGVQRVRFCQCMYGLRLVGHPLGERVRKDTTLLTNVPLGGLSCMCDKSHPHTQLKGNFRHNGRSYRRSALAGAYLRQLCSVWAREATEAAGVLWGHGKTNPAGDKAQRSLP